MYKVRANLFVNSFVTLFFGYLLLLFISPFILLTTYFLRDCFSFVSLITFSFLPFCYCLFVLGCFGSVQLLLQSQYLLALENYNQIFKCLVFQYHPVFFIMFSFVVIQSEKVISVAHLY